MKKKILFFFWFSKCLQNFRVTQYLIHGNNTHCVKWKRQVCLPLLYNTFSSQSETLKLCQSIESNLLKGNFSKKVESKPDNLIVEHVKNFLQINFRAC